MSISDILHNRITTKTFDNIPIEQSKIDYILDCAITAPSKQSLYNYKIAVLGTSRAAKEIKTWMFQSDTWCDEKGERLGTNGRKVLNGQYNAPLVLVWMQREKLRSKYNPTDLVDMMVSSSVAMLAAEEQGLQTGFGRCHSTDLVAEKLGYPGLTAEVVIGVGYGTDHDDEELSDYDHGLQVYTKKGNVLGIMSKNIPASMQVRHRKLKPSISKLIQHY
jgi:hypothetical protein